LSGLAAGQHGKPALDPTALELNWQRPQIVVIVEHLAECSSISHERVHK
jgi:predicted anti-sigma-YlaC factor YlaD